MQGKHWLIVVSVLILGAFSCKELNREGYCPSHLTDPDCAPAPETCGTIKCDPATPVCDDNTTTCVECLDNDDCLSRPKKLCSEQHACVGCQKHEECTESNLCLLDGGALDGECADPGAVTYIGGPNASNNMDCTLDKPCQNLDQAQKANALRQYVKVAGVIAETIPMIDNKKIVIYGGSGAQFSKSAAETVLTIKGTSEVSLFDVEIKGNAAGGGKECVEISESAIVTMKRVDVYGHDQAGISLNGSAKLSLIDSRVHDNKQEGVMATTGTTLELSRSMVYRNTTIGGIAGVYSVGAAMVTIDSSTITLNSSAMAGGVSIAGPFLIRNSIIAANGNVTATTMAGGLNLAPPTATSGKFEFNTVSDNNSSSGTGISCGIAFEVANSIFTNNTLNCINVVYSLVGITGTPTGSNKVGDPKFSTKSLLDPKFYRISSDSAARDSADPNATLGVDIDGQARDDSRKDMGADEFR
jgi:hypothetical protein